MKKKCFIIYNLILFIIFATLIVITFDGWAGSQFSDFAVDALFAFGLAGILSQLILINKELLKKDKQD